jgi:hypothetical protein
MSKDEINIRSGERMLVGLGGVVARLEKRMRGIGGWDARVVGWNTARVMGRREEF